ncbi:hypothetical protein CCHR01_09524 [Colletotrichum chrysophilum]|uniref:Uncharacterized protein n=1 Tax=Colletotrichum chrysophilum TaxID=1836956 RepID=A0AAD9AJK3_9PEZI|nr:hypothetical protein CCHR01_09524 [Colletotrichum chrysophilum]
MLGETTTLAVRAAPLWRIELDSGLGGRSGRCTGQRGADTAGHSSWALYKPRHSSAIAVPLVSQPGKAQGSE